jgi:hypothetical protein
VGDSMGNGLRCDLGTSSFVKDCDELFNKKIEEGKIKKGCDYKIVYDRNVERYNIAVKKDCIN